jgi:putative endonuclease
MTLLDRNWSCEEGEIDLVLRDGAPLVVCEVKTRSSTAAGTPHEAITDEKLARLVRLGERWVAARGVRPPQLRIDLVAVLRPRRGAAIVDHVRGLL